MLATSLQVALSVGFQGVIVGGHVGVIQAVLQLVDS